MNFDVNFTPEQFLAYYQGLAETRDGAPGQFNGVFNLAQLKDFTTVEQFNFLTELKELHDDRREILFKPPINYTDDSIHIAFCLSDLANILVARGVINEFLDAIQKYDEHKRFSGEEYYTPVEKEFCETDFDAQP